MGAVSKPELALRSANDISEAIAMHYAFDLTKDYLGFARTAVSTSKMAEKDSMIQSMDRRAVEIHSHYMAYVQVHTPLSGILKEYNAIMQNVQNLPLDINQLLVSNGTTSSK